MAKSPKPKRHRLAVVYRKAAGLWELKRDGARVSSWGTRAQARREGVKLARCLEREGLHVSLRFHVKAGYITEERTYPRSSDPNPPKG